MNGGKDMTQRGEDHGPSVPPAPPSRISHARAAGFGILFTSRRGLELSCPAHISEHLRYSKCVQTL